MRTSFIIIAGLVIAGLATMFVAERTYSNKLEESAALAKPSAEGVALLTTDFPLDETTATIPQN